jgi:hypothetical protein
MAKERRSKVEIRAFEIWEREGRPLGKAMEHWHQAVAEIAREEEEGAAKLKKAAPRKKAEKAKSIAGSRKTAEISAAKTDPKGRGKKAPPTGKTEAPKKPKKKPK